MMKVYPSWPSSEDHYIQEEILLRRTKALTINNYVALFLIYSIREQVTNIGAHLR
jgi:hypothetical protein